MSGRLAISAGDPAGIGPEIVVKALAEIRLRERPLVFGDPAQLRGVNADVIAAGEAAGEIGAASGRAAVAGVRAAVDAVIEGRAAALVTGPVSKSGLAAAGYPGGQTELLADLCGVSDVHVLIAGGGLHVVHVSAHRSLADAIAGVTFERVSRAISLAAEHGRRLGTRARIGVAGLNPHAGEHGLLGDEELRIIAPAVEAARAAGLDVRGPHSADTLFPRREDFDVIVAMYHDQGHVPVKLLAGGAAVAMSLGLPVIRTSADHGAAPEIAGRGLADPRSMIAAIALAERLACS
jgi:4-phospho-D-threonate 3-dehydrogenase / 4-phospho-D-erythronate 3-dehydrogenase